MQFLPGVAEAISFLQPAGFLVVVVGNQRSVAKGLLTSTELDSIHRRMGGELMAGIDAVWYCPQRGGASLRIC
jgi:D-glycero-D-manno-heptose 1,7-bisphosphate phosphatase